MLKELGKHSKDTYTAKELEDIVKRKDREIKEIKLECAEGFRIIRDLCFCNDCDGKWNKLKKIYELSDDNFKALLEDMFIAESTEEKEEVKKLSTPLKVIDSLKNKINKHSLNIL